MRSASILKHERTFFETRRDTDGKEFILTEKTVPIKGTNEVMPHVSCRLKNKDESFFEKERNEKTQIVLHYNAGYLRGDVAILSRSNYRVSTTFILPRNGKVLNMFSSAFWSYHLGSGAIGGNTNGSKRTIGIEISNIGFLKRIGDNLVTVYGDKDVYCSIHDTNLYTQLDTPYRGATYFATFTEKQYQSLQISLRYLTET